MPTISSPIAFPPGSSTPAPNKRPRSRDAPKPSRPRVAGGFIDDDDDDTGDEGGFAEPSPKRRQLEHAEDNAVQAALATAGSKIGDQNAGAGNALQGGITTPPESQQNEGEELQEEIERYERLFGASQPALATARTVPSNQYQGRTCSGSSVLIRERKRATISSYQTVVAARSKTKEGRATRSYYGIPIHELVDAATKQLDEQQQASANTTAPVTPPAHHLHPDKPIRSVEDRATATNTKKQVKRSMLWTEKYRARTFMDLVGDDLTNRQVLRWLKRWDPIVFPHAVKSKKVARRGNQQSQYQHQQQAEDEKPLRKILMLTGPPGLGKTTLAHVCARQAGYEVLEINASDERSGQVVKGRIRTSLGTQSVKTVEHGRKQKEVPLLQKQKQRKQQQQEEALDKPRKVARPVCVVVDEVDGVVGGSGASGEGGFVKALIDLVLLDQSNSNLSGNYRRKKGDDFRQMRPLVLICNDVYHPSLRPLRQSGLAEIIHVGKPALDAVVTRLKTVFEKEGIPCEKDAARKLCEAAWGVTSSGIDARRGAESNVEGDLRGVMVVGEWVAGRLRAMTASAGADAGTPCLTRQWVDKYVVHDLAHGGGGARGLGRGGVREIVSRVFMEGAGFPRQAAATAAAAAAAATVPKNMRHEQPQEQLGFAEQQRKYAMTRLREMVDTSGEADRVVTEVFAEFPAREFNDDSFLSKPDAGYEWLHFHDACSARLWGGSQDWELAPYMSLPVLACHYLFASPYSKRGGFVDGGNNYGYGYGYGYGNNANGRNTYHDQKGGENTSEDGTPATAPVPFSGPRAHYEAREAEKVNRAALQGIQARLSPSLARAFRGPEHIATDFLPYLVRLVSPDVKPVLVGGSGGGTDSKSGTAIMGPVASVRREAEKIMVRRAAEVLADVGVVLLRGRLENGDERGGPVGRAQWVYRMDPDLDALATFETAGAAALPAPTRYAVRQVLDQELQRTTAQRENAARQARFRAGGGTGAGPHGSHEDGELDKENRRPDTKRTGQKDAGKSVVAVKRDFFGRVLEEVPMPLGESDGNAGRRRASSGDGAPARMVWVTFHEGLNNAVTKPISLEEFLRGL